MIRPGARGMLWVIAALSVALVPQIPRMPLPVAVMTLAPIAWRLVTELRGWKPLPAMARYLVTGLSLTALFVSHGGLFGRRASVSLLAAMLALKLLECERLRDARLVVSFSFFLCATQFLFAQGIFMPVYGLAMVVVGLVALAQLQRSEAFPGARVPPPLPGSAVAEVGFGLRMLLIALPIALVFFVFFPRWGSPLWGVPEATLDAKSGLSDSMSPGSIQNLFMDDSPAFRVLFASAVPQRPDLYWRGPVFWHYDGNTWTSSFYGRNIEAEARPGEGGRSWRYTVQLEPNERNWLFALDYPVAAPVDSRLTLDFQLLRRQPVIQLMQYEVVSNPDFIDSPQLRSTLRTMALELPDKLNPRTRELVERWRREAPGDRAFIERVLQHFNQEEFRYSLDSPLLGTHAVDEFLFETRLGFCEHYASSFAVMLRMAGIPSRVVTGYQGGWFSEFGDYLLLRQSDAHAWTEAWLEGSGWTRFDPTAAVSPSRVESGSLSALEAPRHVLDYDWVRSVRNGFDLLEQRWNTWVIEFDAGRQSRLFSGLGLPRVGPGGLVAILFVALAMVGLLLAPLILRIRGPGRRDPLQQNWERFLKRLARAGYRHPPSEGAMELAAAAQARFPAQAETIGKIATMYMLRRYAPSGPTLDEFRAAVRRFRLARAPG